MQVLQELPIGLLDDEIQQIIDKEVEFDSESGKIRYQSLFGVQLSHDQNIHQLAYIEDLDVIIYSTHVPKTSCIFASLQDNG